MTPPIPSSTTGPSAISRRALGRRLRPDADPELSEARRRLTVPADAGGLERRRFLQAMMAAGSLAAFGGLAAFGDRAEAGPPLGADERILVVLLMAGGNDSLNTLIPLEDGRYHDARGSLAIASSPHGVGDGLYLHPNLGSLKNRFDAGKVAVIRGVGDALDDHSHFVNLARWMSGTATSGPWYTGWLGRYLDGVAADNLAGISIGYQGVPLQLARSNGGATSLPPTGNMFGTTLADNTYDRPTFDALLSIDPAGIGRPYWAQQMTAAVADSITTASRLHPVFNPEIDEEDRLVRDATIAGRLINLDIGARIISLEMGGYDVHEGQRPAHDDFMTSVDRAIHRLFRTIDPALRSRVMVMTYSEFGRRVEANGSAGTDHGTAGTMFLIGDTVNGGLYGAQPSLRNLDSRGDLQHTVDFRSVYATVLEDWLGADATEVLGTSHETLPFLSYECRGERATIVGTPGNDTITGTDGRDVIVALGGADLIYGASGNDLICTGPGNDRVFAGDGNDTVYGDEGSDDLRGEDGNDRLYGGQEGDQLHGGRGSDTLTGGSGSDQLFGRAGTDTIAPDASDVVVRGS